METDPLRTFNYGSPTEATFRGSSGDSAASVGGGQGGQTSYQSVTFDGSTVGQPRAGSLNNSPRRKKVISTLL